MWVARDEDGYLHLYKIKPSRDNVFKDWEVNFNENCLTLNKKLFPELKWQDEPIEVELKEVQK